MATSGNATGVGTSVFKGLKTPREILQYNLMRGVTDFSNLEQYDLYEKGYPFLMVVKAPDFLMDLADANPTGIKPLVDNYIHILENDFRGIDSMDNITGESTTEITNGIRSIQIINKVTKPSNSNFTMNYYERSGSVMTKVNELYLTGIKDADTQVKHYHGLIDDYVFNGRDSTRHSASDPGPHRECWSFLYFLTDNTMTKIERAFLIAAAQPNIADFGNLYTGQKGQIEFAEIQLSFNGFFISNDMVYMKAQRALLAMRNPKNLTGSRIIVDSNNFVYSGIEDIDKNVFNGGNTTENDGSHFDNRSWWNTNGQANDLSELNNKTGSKDSYSDGAYTNSVKNTDSMSGGEHFINSSTREQ